MQYLVPIVFALTVSTPGFAQLSPEEAKSRRGRWNGVFEQIENLNIELRVNPFLQMVAANLPLGRALDAGIGQGRNALWLAEQGWQVTGVDISDKGVEQAEQRARDQGVEIDGVVADLYGYDYGEEKWDLVVSTYMHEILIGNAEKVIASLKPGGLLVVEGFHWDHNGKSVQDDQRFGFKVNELPRAFDSLRILHYEDLSTAVDWGPNRSSDQPIVRFLARKVSDEQAN